MTEKVLLVDDEQDFLSIMSERMKARGMDVSTAASAKEAIQLAEAESFDAIILDLQMPGMDGLEALRALKAKKPEIQVILLTGHATVEKSVEAMKLGAMDLMEKPADLKTLTDKIKKAQTRKKILIEKQAEEKMNVQAIEAGKLASVGELASGIAHEINNPIAIMVEEAGWLSDLLSDEDLANPQNMEEFRRALNQIKAQGGRCKDITHKLLFFAKKTDSRVREVQINDIIKENFLYWYKKDYLRAQVGDVGKMIEKLREEYKITNKGLLIQGGIILGIVILLFILHGMLHMEASIAAMIGAAVLMVISKVDIVEMLEKEIEWLTLIFFMMLFMVVAGAEGTGLIQLIAGWVKDISQGNLVIAILMILWVSALASAIIDNIPFAATMLPIVGYLTTVIPGAESGVLWWALSLGACLGGNGTMIGASANLVTVGMANGPAIPSPLWRT